MKDASLKGRIVWTPKVSVQLLWFLFKMRAKKITLRAILDLRWGIYPWQFARTLMLIIAAQELQISWNLPDTSRC